MAAVTQHVSSCTPGVHCGLITRRSRVLFIRKSSPAHANERARVAEDSRPVNQIQIQVVSKNSIGLASSWGDVDVFDVRLPKGKATPRRWHGRFFHSPAGVRPGDEIGGAFAEGPHLGSDHGRSGEHVPAAARSADGERIGSRAGRVEITNGGNSRHIYWFFEWPDGALMSYRRRRLCPATGAYSRFVMRPRKYRHPLKSFGR